MERDSVFNNEKQKEKENSITGLGRWRDDLKGKGACSPGLKTGALGQRLGVNKKVEGEF